MAYRAAQVSKTAAGASLGAETGAKMTLDMLHGSLVIVVVVVVVIVVIAVLLLL
jgi:hypothetical protein